MCHIIPERAITSLSSGCIVKEQRKEQACFEIVGGAKFVETVRPILRQGKKNMDECLRNIAGIWSTGNAGPILTLGEYYTYSRVEHLMRAVLIQAGV